MYLYIRKTVFKKKEKIIKPKNSVTEIFKNPCCMDSIVEWR